MRELGVATDLVTAGEVLGLSRNVSYRLAAEGAFPVRVLRLGAQHRVPVADLLGLLGIDPNSSEAGPATGPAFALAADPTNRRVAGAP